MPDNQKVHGDAIESQGNEIAITTTEQSISMYTVFRQYLVHEDDLINQRTTWSITIQGFIIVAFGLSFQNRLNLNIANAAQIQSITKFDREYGMLILALATLGLGVSLICLVSVRAGQIAIRGLIKIWGQWHNAHPRSPGYPPLSGGGEYWATRLGHAAPIVLQSFFVLFWITVLMLQLFVRFGLLTFVPGTVSTTGS
jgi:hypothetical protein